MIFELSIVGIMWYILFVTAKNYVAVNHPRGYLAVSYFFIVFYIMNISYLTLFLLDIEIFQGELLVHIVWETCKYFC